MPTDRLWKPFIIPRQVINSASIRSSPILRLPTEILVEIFDHTGPVDQLALALVCKHLLQVSASISLKTSSLVGRRVSRHRSTMEDLLRLVKPLNTAGRPKKAWAICVDCLQYRPTKRSYWKKKRASGAVMSIWENGVANWNDQYLLQCPECRYNEAMP